MYLVELEYVCSRRMHRLEVFQAQTLHPNIADQRAGNPAGPSPIQLKPPAAGLTSTGVRRRHRPAVLKRRQTERVEQNVVIIANLLLSAISRHLAEMAVRWRRPALSTGRQILVCSSGLWMSSIARYQRQSNARRYQPDASEVVNR